MGIYQRHQILNGLLFFLPTVEASSKAINKTKFALPRSMSSQTESLTQMVREDTNHGIGSSKAINKANFYLIFLIAFVSVIENKLANRRSLY